MSQATSRIQASPSTLRRVMLERELAPGEWSVLALLAEEPGHGWALARQMARDGEIGRVWALGRPLVYRALELLEERGLIEPVGSERGVRGPNRTVFRATPEGREALAEWLEVPVEHVRDVRSLLLLKLVLIDRAGLDREPLLNAQRGHVVPAIATLEKRLGESTGSEAIFVRFRLESTKAVLDFIDGLLAEQPSAAAAQR
jgi:DNA-binding PadR family transcriptional regulator